MAGNMNINCNFGAPVFGSLDFGAMVIIADKIISALGTSSPFSFLSHYPYLFITISTFGKSPIGITQPIFEQYYNRRLTYLTNVIIDPLGKNETIKELILKLKLVYILSQIITFKINENVALHFVNGESTNNHRSLRKIIESTRGNARSQISAVSADRAIRAAAQRNRQMSLLSPWKNEQSACECV